jgi:hypothetical protein
LFQVFAAASFHSIWYWVLHVVVWTLACYRTLGVPHDMLLRARRLPEIAARVDLLAQLAAARVGGVHDLISAPSPPSRVRLAMLVVIGWHQHRDGTGRPRDLLPFGISTLKLRLALAIEARHCRFRLVLALARRRSGTSSSPFSPCSWPSAWRSPRRGFRPSDPARHNQTYRPTAARVKPTGAPAGIETPTPENRHADLDPFRHQPRQRARRPPARLCFLQDQSDHLLRDGGLTRQRLRRRHPRTRPTRAAPRQFTPDFADRPPSPGVGFSVSARPSLGRAA